jgi:hypothetical protein
MVGELIVGGLILGAICKIFGGGPEKTEVRYKGVFGDSIVRTRYHDTGKETKRVTRPGLLGGTVSKTYITRQGRKRQ